ncbi:MAG: vWA domain-containing protein [Kofleriaceae bacterium]
MIRPLVVVLALLAAACGHKQPAISMCADQVPLPAGCEVSCNPAPGAPSTCPSGYHCTADGACDKSCTPTGGECGVGFLCTADGSCMPDGTGGGDPPIDAADCPAVHFSATPVTPSIQLLIDRSSSMTENFDNQSPPAAGPYKYPTVQDALVGTNGVVTHLESSVYFGATLFTAFKTACPSLQSTPRLKNNRAAIASLISTNPPRLRSDKDPGYTPTPLGINAVVDDFAAHPAPDGSPPVIVLATDGQPNECTTTSPRLEESVAAAANAYAHGIKLYILAVSFGDDADRPHVQAMANAGQGVQPGQPDATPYYATSPDELAAAFQTIIGGVVSCDLQISGHVAPADGPNGSLMLNGTNLVYGTDWTLDADGITVHLLGNACTLLKSSSNPKLDGTFPCGTIIF